MEQVTLNGIKKLSLALSSPSEIYMGEGAARIATDYAKDKNTFLVTDSTVFRIYQEWIKENFSHATVFVFKAGEKRKNQKTLFSILKAMKESGLSRKDLVVALGGGVVGDITGFAAALFMRGVEVLQIPTTLLAQVDSSVGGKTAVDYCGVKNLIGAFHQPRLVCVDPFFLKTLPQRELVCGMGEIIKTATLDESLFDFFSDVTADQAYGDLAFLFEAATRSIEVKARIVCADEKETTGLRKTLNVGHTLGHAIEMNYGNRSHGQCVAWGIALEILSCGRQDVDANYLSDLGLLIYKLQGRFQPFDVRRVVQNAMHDKKNENGKISMIVPVQKGKTKEVFLSKEELTKNLTNLMEKRNA